MSDVTWADLALEMLAELRMDYAPMALTDLDGRAAIAKLRAQVATLRAERDEAAQATLAIAAELNIAGALIGKVREMVALNAPPLEIADLLDAYLMGKG